MKKSYSIIIFMFSLFVFAFSFHWFSPDETASFCSAILRFEKANSQSEEYYVQYNLENKNNAQLIFYKTGDSSTQPSLLILNFNVAPSRESGVLFHFSSSDYTSSFCSDAKDAPFIDDMFCRKNNAIIVKKLFNALRFSSPSTPLFICVPQP